MYQRVAFKAELVQLADQPSRHDLSRLSSLSLAYMDSAFLHNQVEKILRCATLDLSVFNNQDLAIGVRRGDVVRIQHYNHVR